MCDYNPRWGNWSPSRFARDHRWKLYDDGRFYDVLNDVLEEYPLIKGPLPKRARQIWNRLQRVLDDHGAKK